MPEVQTGKIKRKFLAHYIDTSAPGGSTPTYFRLGKDLEAYTTEMSANVETKPNILGETNTTIDSYQKSASVEPYYAELGETLFERLQTILDKEQTLDDLNTTVVEVHLWEEDASKEGVFIAYREDAVIEVSSYGGDTTGYQIPFTLHYTGNKTAGTFNTSTKTFTPKV